jgi:hypothetical protein
MQFNAAGNRSHHCLPRVGRCAGARSDRCGSGRNLGTVLHGTGDAEQLADVTTGRITATGGYNDGIEVTYGQTNVGRMNNMLPTRARFRPDGATAGHHR